VRVARDWAKAGVNEHIKAALEAEVARGGKEEIANDPGQDHRDGRVRSEAPC